MINKIKFILPIILFLSLSIVGCKKYDGDSYDFSNTTNSYMMFTTTSATFNDGKSASGTTYISTPKNVVLTSRIGFSEPISVVLTLQITGGSSRTVNVSYDKFVTSKTVSITIGESDFPAGTNVVNGTITLSSAASSKYGDLRLGYPAEGTKTVVPFKAYRPGSPVQ